MTTSDLGVRDITAEVHRVLDHGFVRVVDYMGDDAAIEDAARVSYGAGTRKVSERRALIRYLLRHRHTSPFEMATVKLHVKAPIFVFRQWHRHRTQSYNEQSARYSVMTDDMYMPMEINVARQSRDNKQGRDEMMTSGVTAKVVSLLGNTYQRARNTYHDLLSTDLARELARLTMPVGTYSEMYVSASLLNWYRFVQLRSDPHAQYEIRVYSDLILDCLRYMFPLSTSAFEDYWLHGTNLSRVEIAWLKRRLAGDEHFITVTEALDCSKRELEEFARKFDISEEEWARMAGWKFGEATGRDRNARRIA